MTDIGMLLRHPYEFKMETTTLFANFYTGLLVLVEGGSARCGDYVFTIPGGVVTN